MSSAKKVYECDKCKSLTLTAKLLVGLTCPHCPGGTFKLADKHFAVEAARAGVGEELGSGILDPRIASEIQRRIDSSLDSRGYTRAILTELIGQIFKDRMREMASILGRLV